MLQPSSHAASTLLARHPVDLELRVAVAIVFLAVGRQEVAPARAVVAADVLELHREAVAGRELAKERVALDLGRGALRHALVAAILGANLVEPRLILHTRHLSAQAARLGVVPRRSVRESAMQDHELLSEFEATTLPFEIWQRHRTHVKVAFLMLRAHPFDEALVRMRRGIQAINDKAGVPNGPLTGYNETTTHASLHLIHACMTHYAATHPTADADEFWSVHTQFHSKHILRLFYSPARRILPEAKARFVEPDLAPLPSVRLAE